MQVIDIKYWLNETAGWAGSAAVAVEGEKLAEIITWITSRDRGLPAGEALKGWRRPKRKPCKGILKIHSKPINRTIRIFYGKQSA